MGDGQARPLLVAPPCAEPIMWDFGSAARHHQLYCPWLEAPRAPGGHLDRCAEPCRPTAAGPRTWRDKVWRALEAHGLHREPLGVDVVEPAVLFALQRRGLEIVDGQQLMQAARVRKTSDEIMLLDTACMMVDAAYEELYREMRPGMRENECVGLVEQGALRPRLRARRGRERHLWRAGQPAPARLLRPRAAARRSGLLRHPAQPPRLPHLLLPHVRRGQRLARPGRRLPPLPRSARPADRPRPSRA